jgi:leucyl-tRNA synthetase
VWRAVHAAVAPDGDAAGPADLELVRLSHRTTAAVTDDLERFRFNTAISKLMVLSNGLADAIRAGRGTAEERRDAAQRLVLLLAPLAPFVTEELWRVLGHQGSVHLAAWPGFDPELVRSERVTCVLQVDGKVRDRVEVDPDTAEDDLRELALASERVRAALGERQVARVVVANGTLLGALAATLGVVLGCGSFWSARGLLERLVDHPLAETGVQLLLEGWAAPGSPGS